MFKTILKIIIRYLLMIIISTIIGAIFSVIINRQNPFYYAFVGAMIGFIGSILSIVFENYVAAMKSFKKIRTIYHFMIRTIFYAFVFGILMILLIGIKERMSIRFVFTDTRFLFGFIFSMAISLVFNFYNEMIRLVGAISLINFFTGKYNNPKIEKRIFMFLDIKFFDYDCRKNRAYKFPSFPQRFLLRHNEFHNRIQGGNL